MFGKFGLNATGLTGRPSSWPTLADWFDFPLREVYVTTSTVHRTTSYSWIDTSCRFQVIAHPAHWGKPAIGRRFLKLPRFFGGRRRNGTGLVSSWSADCRWKASTGDATPDKQTNKRCHVCGERGESRMVSLVSVQYYSTEMFLISHKLNLCP